MQCLDNSADAWKYKVHTHWGIAGTPSSISVPVNPVAAVQVLVTKRTVSFLRIQHLRPPDGIGMGVSGGLVGLEEAEDGRDGEVLPVRQTDYFGGHQYGYG